MKKNTKILLGVILGIIVLAGIVAGALAINSRIQKENNAINAEKERIAATAAEAAAKIAVQKQLVEDFKNIYGSLYNFKSIISKGATGIDIEFFDVAFINETDFACIGNSSKLSSESEDGTDTLTSKGFIKKFTKGSDKAVWTKEYKEYYFNDVTVTKTGDILAVGNADFEGPAFIIKYSGDGKQLWRKDWKGTAQAVTLDDENNFLIVGGNTILKLDSDGKQLWKKSVNNGYELLSCVQDADKNYLAVGNHMVGGEGEPFERKAIIAKYSKNGEQLWKKEYKETDDCALYSIKALSGGGVVVAGAINNSVYNNDDEDYTRDGSVDGVIIKYNSDGDIISKIQYNSVAPDEVFYDIEIVSLNGKDDVVIAVGESYNMDKESGEIVINETKRALMVVFDNDKVLYEHTLSGYDASSFKRICLYNNDWKNCILPGSVFDDKSRKGGEPFVMWYGGYQGLLMFK